MYKIPNIDFNKKKENRFEFEILSLQELYAKKNDFSVPYEKNTILIILKGQVHAFNMNSSVKGFAILVNNPFLFENSIHSDALLLSRFYAIPYDPLIMLKETSQQYFKNLIDTINTEYHNRGRYV